MWRAIDDANLKGLMYIAMLAVNLPSMPDDIDMRFGQLRDLMREHFAISNPNSSPLFQYLSAEMHVELQGSLVIEEGESKDLALCKHLQNENHFRKKDKHACVARFCSVVAGARALVQSWHCRAFELGIASIEGNMLTAKHLPSIAMKFKGGDEASRGEEHTTSRAVVSTVDRLLHSCGANGVVVSLALVSDDVNKRHLAAVLHAGQIAMDWSGSAAKQMKSITENQAWFVQQIGGGLAGHVGMILSTLESGSYLRDASLVPAVCCKDSTTVGVLAFEDEVANLGGTFVVNLAKHQLKRFLWFFGYPHMLHVLNGGSAEEQRKSMQNFKLDLQIFGSCRAACTPQLWSSST